MVLLIGKEEKKTSGKSYNLSFSSIKLMTLIALTIVGIQIGLTFPIVNSLYIPESMQVIILQLANQKGIFSFIPIVIAAPIIEEFIFRGIILDGFLRKFSPTKSILVSKHSIRDSSPKPLAIHQCFYSRSIFWMGLLQNQKVNPFNPYTLS